MSTKQKILESAAVLFSEKGYANTSVAEICRSAGANIAAVNYHFHSKEKLYQEVLRYTFSQAEQLYPQEAASTDSAEQRLYLFILSLLQRIFSNETKGNFYRLISQEMAEPTAASGDLLPEIINRKCELLRGIILELYHGRADEVLLLQMTHSIVSQCLFLGVHEKGRMHHLKRRPLTLGDAEPFARHITRFCLAGIRCYDA